MIVACTSSSPRIKTHNSIIFEWTVENVSKQLCGHDSIDLDVSSMIIKMHAIENAFEWTGP